MRNKRLRTPNRLCRRTEIILFGTGNIFLFSMLRGHKCSVAEWNEKTTSVVKSLRLKIKLPEVKKHKIQMRRL